MATVSTYFQPVQGLPRPTKLLELWRESWESKGWTTKILSESDAKDHPGYKAFSDRISRYPTINNPGYERACYMRHMAMANVGGGYLSDYDCLLMKKETLATKEDVPLPSHPVIFEPTRVPCLVCGDQDAFGDICDIIFNYDPNGERHVSDMTILRKTKIQTSFGCVEHLNSGAAIVDDPGDGWKDAPVVHFSGFSFKKLGWTGDKADLIRRVLATL